MAGIHHLGLSTDPDSLRLAVHKALAGLLCEHTEARTRPCYDCNKLVEDKLLIPVCRFAYRAAMGNRVETVIGKADGYESLGVALEKFFHDCAVELPAAIPQADGDAR